MTDRRSGARSCVEAEALLVATAERSFLSDTQDTCPSFSFTQELCSQAVPDAACKSAACLVISGVFYKVTWRRRGLRRS